MALPAQLTPQLHTREAQVLEINPQTASPLFSLPSELRLNIYHHVFGTDQTYKITTCCFELVAIKSPWLLLVCRAVHHEALDAL